MNGPGSVLLQTACMLTAIGPLPKTSPLVSGSHGARLPPSEDRHVRQRQDRERSADPHHDDERAPLPRGGPPGDTGMLKPPPNRAEAASRLSGAACSTQACEVPDTPPYASP